MNDVPRRVMLIVLVAALCFVLIKLLPFFWPFLIGLIIAWMMEPLARVLRKALRKLPFGRGAATLICMLLFYGIVGIVVVLVSGKLLQEGLGLIKNLPDIARTVYNEASGWLATLPDHLPPQVTELLPGDISTQLESLLKSALANVSTWAVSISAKAASFTISKAVSLPYAILAIVFTIMGSFYMSYDRERILNFFRNLFPAHVVKNVRLIKGGVFSALFGQIRAQCFISFVITLVVIAGLTLTGRPYPLVIGILIGIADVLPVIGAGLFLNPWAVVLLAIGEYTVGIGMFLTYIAVVTVRQIIEPRIVGQQLGLYPLVTMMCMFAGFKVLGATGLIVGPLVANLCRVTLDADAGTLQERKQERLTIKLIFKQLFGKKAK